MKHHVLIVVALTLLLGMTAGVFAQGDSATEQEVRNALEKYRMPVRANRRVGPNQNEIRKVKQRKTMAEKLVAHTLMVATQCRPCRRAVPAR